MFRVSLFIACLASAGAYAQDAHDDCAAGDGPRITEGLPMACGTGVVIRRGPEVAPTPSEARVEPEPGEESSRRVVRRAVSPWGESYSLRRVESGYVPVLVERRRRPQLSFVYRDDNVFLRIGTPPHKERRVHRDYRPEQPLGFSSGR